MAMEGVKDGKRRFAPIPIETTFEQIRRPGPVGELTPDPSPEPSPRSPQHTVTFETSTPNEFRKERRRFAPQLIDSSRRSRRIGDMGPATRPTDKTDIVPHQHHIYSVHRSKKRHHRITDLSRRESCDEETAEHMFGLAKKEIEKRLQEIALSAFPNSSARIGGAEHFVVDEGSEDENELDPRGRPQLRLLGTDRPKRDSTDEDMNWHVKEAQNAANRRARTRVDTKDLDLMELDSPPPDTMFLTSSRKQTPSPGPSPFIRGPIGESHMPLVSHSPLKPIGETSAPSQSPPPIQPIGEFQMPYIPSAPPGRAGDMPFIPSETGFLRHGGGRPFGAGYRRDMPSSERNLEQLRQRSPPMLGKDITFRMCPSPKRTKMEPDHLWARIPEASNRDPSGTKGLWRGYCYTSEAESGTALASVARPAMLQTPSVASSAGTDPFSAAFGTFETISTVLSEEPTPIASPRGTQSAGPASLKLPKPAATVPPASSNMNRRSAEAKGIHMLAGLEERLRKEKAAADLTEQIQAEFTDHFVTQVYNYLSLGYPAMARMYDEELSKISRIDLYELRRHDSELMDFMVDIASGGDGRKKGAKGYIRLTEDDDTKEQDRCPRWKALKLYIHEWARQHPDLDSISPLAWGVRERRGSWGI